MESKKLLKTRHLEKSQLAQETNTSIFQIRVYLYDSLNYCFSLKWDGRYLMG